MSNNESQTFLFDCNKDFYLFAAGTTSGMKASIDVPQEEYISIPSTDLNSIFSIDRSSVNPIFSPKNIFSTFITESEIGKEIEFPGIINPEFYSEINNSKRFLKLMDNWDNLGSKFYKLETWIKMKNFLLKIARDFYNHSSLLLPPPYINPSASGAFDLHWKTKDFELLLRIPEENDVLISFYGDNYKQIKIRGTLEVSKLKPLIEWITLYSKNDYP